MKTVFSVAMYKCRLQEGNGTVTILVSATGEGFKVFSFEKCMSIVKCTEVNALACSMPPW